MKMPHFSHRVFWSLLLIINLVVLISSSIFAESLSLPETAFGNESDRLALLDLKSHFVDGPDGILSSWNSSIHFCMWAGVTCGRRHQRVTLLGLSSQGIGGYLSPGIGNLSFLRGVDLSINQLQGAIPSSLGNLSSIFKILALGQNSFNGNIPNELGQLKGLTFLGLDGNNLTGIIPFTLYNLSSIEVLSLTNNRLSGTPLPKLGLSFPNLLELDLGMNQFTGSIPLPPLITNISGLQIFDVAINHLTGGIDNNVGKLKDLFWFNLGRNILGTGKLGDLSFLCSLTNTSGLRVLDISFNHFGGELPNCITNLSNLEILGLGDNEFHGSIPEKIGNLKSLIKLGAERNHLTGLIPSSICKLQNLGLLVLGGNRLFGPIPSFIGNLTALNTLTLEENQLNGSIPLSLKNCTSMEVLGFGQNSLSGRIPAELIGNLKNLIFLDLELNTLSESFPREVNNLKILNKMWISENKFSGQIPSELGDCLLLKELSLAGNLFEGSIPVSLSSLKGIESIDLSRNNLSGRIPNQLQHLQYLESLNLSFNHLDGEVPREGVFKNMSAISLMGNKKLCGGVPQLKFPPCTILKKEVKLLSTKAIIVVIIACVVLLVLVVSSIILIFQSKAPKTNSSPTSLKTMGHTRISYKEILEATGGFASSNLIGAGSFGFVYKGVVGEDNKLVAIKVLNLEKNGATKSFAAECRALSKIRHRNLVKILTSCSSVDYKGNDFLALVFELMPNGSLHNWLHETRDLTLAQRLDIAIDIASALGYLHHHCDPQIVHCDLKPNNVLLDEDMVAHVGDFGLARLLNNYNSKSCKDHSSSSAIKGSIGYVAPEYGMGEDVSPKGDVYSYGILLLEMITGKRPTDDVFGSYMNLHTFAKMALPLRIRDILDSCLLSELEEAISNHIVKHDLANIMCESMVSMAELGVACSLEYPGERMDINNVIKGLQKIKNKLSMVR